jgi:ABC-type bacteriocin/lantibiotic exporter with double-glycine peptidase domain
MPIYAILYFGLTLIIYLWLFPDVDSDYSLPFVLISLGITTIIFLILIWIQKIIEKITKKK